LQLNIYNVLQNVIGFKLFSLAAEIEIEIEIEIDIEIKMARQR